MKYGKLSRSGHQIETKNYTLKLFDGIDPARLALHKSIQEYWFFPGGSVNTVGKYDAGTDFGKWRKKDTADSLVFTRTEKSLLWKEKKTTIICGEKSLEIFLEITGSGPIEDVRFFQGCVNDVEYGFVGEFDEVVNTAPNFHGKIYYHPVESFSISAGEDLSLAVGGQALASCCPCVALRDRSESCFLVAGAAAVPGENTWDCFRWNPSAVISATGYEGDEIRGGGFSLEYCGKKKISGCWRTPSLLLSFCHDQEDILPSWLKECYARSYLKKPRRKPVRKWWRSPIYCTWHDQCAASMLGQSNFIGSKRPHAREFCTEKQVEEWLGALIAHDCKPGILILDDKWQLNLNDADPDTEKFPDMRGWIERCHQRGIRVFLWTAAWNNDRISRDEAITRDGKVVCGDITTPNTRHGSGA